MIAFMPRLYGRELRSKIANLHWGLIILLAIAGIIGIAALYSVANGSFEPWSSRQLIRLIIGFIMMIAVAVIDIRIWLSAAYLIFIFALAALISVELFGGVHMGVARWLDLNIIRVQPSEPMRIALILTLARYYHHLPPEKVSQPLWLILPVLLILVPTVLIIRQPDLGTALLFALTGISVLFLAGLSWRYFMVGGLSLIPAIWLIWGNLRNYQKERVLTFLNPDRDPLGAGYHILQSKIAIGSGGLSGKGFMNGTQTHLNFLPEKHTDFIFTILAEEMGFFGCLFVLLFYISILIIGFNIARQARNHFSRLLASSICVALFLYLFVNVAMVIGILPVVGVPMPLISYGGTSMITILFSMGLLLNVHLHRNVELPKN